MLRPHLQVRPINMSMPVLDETVLNAAAAANAASAALAVVQAARAAAHAHAHEARALAAECHHSNLRAEEEVGAPIEHHE